MSMYLSKIPLNPRRLATQRLIADRRALHAAILAGSPDQPVPLPALDQPRVLWRLDTDQPYRPVVLAVTPTRPDYLHLAEQAGWPASEAPFLTRDYRPLLDRLTAGQRYTFRLTANATHSVRGGGQPDAPDAPAERQRGKRMGHVTQMQQLGWLLERAPRLGIRLPPLAGSGQPDVTVTGRSREAFRHDQGRVTLAVATFEGRLQITDPVQLRQALTRGVGPAKAYGCGLLTLAPTR